MMNTAAIALGLLLKLQTASLHPVDGPPELSTRSYSATYGMQVCVAETKQELREHGRHLFFCVEAATGSGLGAVLNANGRPVCSVIGLYGGGCLVVNVCGDTRGVCL